MSTIRFQWRVFSVFCLTTISVKGVDLSFFPRVKLDTSRLNLENFQEQKQTPGIMNSSIQSVNFSNGVLISKDESPVYEEHIATTITGAVEKENNKSEMEAVYKDATPSNHERVEENGRLNKTDGVPTFFINTDDCAVKSLSIVLYTDGYVDGILTKNGSSLISESCQWKVEVPKGLFILASIEMKEACMDGAYIQASEQEDMDACLLDQIKLRNIKEKRTVASLSNYIFFRVGAESVHSTYLPSFRVYIRVTTHSYRLTLPSVFDSQHSGYVTSPGYDADALYPRFMNASFRLDVPVNHVVMISFQRIDIYGYNQNCIEDSISLFVFDDVTGARLNWKGCMEHLFTTAVYNSSLILRFITDGKTEWRGFRMFFSFHPPTQIPLIVGGNLFNCSVSYYWSFKRHLECNLQLECLDGEDEQNCPFSSPVCNGSVAFQNKCYSYHSLDRYIAWEEAQSHCQSRGGNLASPKTTEEREAVEKLIHHGKRQGPAYIGLNRINSDLPVMYTYVMTWSDDSIGYNVNFSLFLTPYDDTKLCGRCSICSPFSVKVKGCRHKDLSDFICEAEAFLADPITEESLQFPRPENPLSSTTVANQFLLQCDEGHITLNFLSCNPESFCGENRYLFYCKVSNRNKLKTPTSSDALSFDNFTQTAMFVCEDRKRTIHYTLVCDFQDHCIDRSDEDFCSHENCSEYTCRNHQCVSSNKLCNRQEDCFDGTDEKYCKIYNILTNINSIRLDPPAIINFDHHGNFSQIKIQRSQPCPMTHFRCHGELSFCLPVYVRCNGVFDCPDHEDEMGCNLYMCPGFYHCFDSRICVYLDNVCDGVVHCPKRDDELLCEFRCPDGCLCQGLAFICRRNFTSSQFPQLRYLDADGSGMSLKDISSNFYLIWLSLKRCNLVNIPEMFNPNLVVLDLSENLITSINMNSFLTLKQMKNLILARNPIVHLSSDLQIFRHYQLESVDISNTALRNFDSSAFKNYPVISFLNVSFSAVEVIADTGFYYMSALKIFDARGAPLVVFPRKLFRKLKQLENVLVDNYRLCCKEALPEQFNEEFCLSLTDVISNCEDLLRFVFHRLFVWIWALMATIGNCACLFFLLFIHKSTFSSAYLVFFKNLIVSDLLMGIYLFVVVGFDLFYRGDYIYYEHSWKQSVTCKIAGFMSLLSIEVSVFITCLLTVDRLIALRYPQSVFRFKNWTAALISVIAWIAGITVASIPLLPVTSLWEFYGQTAVCSAFPVSLTFTEGHLYWFGLIIVPYLLVFVITAIGEMFVYLSTRATYLTTDTTQISLDKNIARRLTTTVLSRTSCLFFVGVVSLLGFTGQTISGELKVAVSIIIMPLNSALNPFFFALGLLSENRRKAYEIHLRKWMKVRTFSKKSFL